ncbi:MAG: DsbA family protein [Thermoleophilaceae bacterium]
MPVRVLCISDPACAWSWASEPGVHMLRTEFGGNLRFTFVMAGLARQFEPGVVQVEAILEASAGSGMPVDPRLWLQSPPRSSYPACMAVVAAREQGEDACFRLLRELREGLMVFRRRLDTTEALIEAARTAGLDAERFRVDLGSSGTVEAFGSDLERAAELSDGGQLPTFVFEADEAEPVVVGGVSSPAELRGAATRAGAEPSGEDRPDPMGAIGRFGRLATVEVAAICDLPALKAEADLLALALQWRVRPVGVGGTGRLWEAA